ncbi:MAG TPA: hypothetical protein PKW35_11430, partial [Nannocystaceae bacterium]|nr:hypothetical protein [Nannocystaceae bacterium]
MLPTSVDAKPAHPPTPYPRGWYLAAHDDEVAVRPVVPLRLFGRDLVVLRTDAARAHTTDAHSTEESRVGNEARFRWTPKHLK